MTGKRIWLLIIILLVLASIFVGFTGISLVENIYEKLVAVLGTILMASLIIERGLDVFLTTLRAEKSEKMSRAINEIKILAGNGDSSIKAELSKLEDEQFIFKSQTRIIALWSGLLAGVILGIIGFRALNSLVSPDEFELLKNFQKIVFNAVDIFLTGCVLAGGSDSIHKIMDSFRLFMEKKS